MSDRAGAGGRRLLAVHAGSAGADRARRTAWLAIPFPWVLGEAHRDRHAHQHRRRPSSTTIAVAVPTPTPTRRSSGIAGAARRSSSASLPVALGLMFYPALRGVGRGGMTFVLALTVGLLAFLLVDTLEEALELARPKRRRSSRGRRWSCWPRAGELPAADGGRAPARGAPTGLALATFIALGIGLHNLGEGLAIGAAFAAGAAGLGTFLVLGFTLHNITEGIGIAAPILEAAPAALDLRRPDAARRRPGGRRHVARQPRLRAAMVGAGACRRCRRHPAGDRRGLGLSACVRRTAAAPFLAGRFQASSPELPSCMLRRRS